MILTELTGHLDEYTLEWKHLLGKLGQMRQQKSTESSHQASDRRTPDEARAR